MGEQGQFRTWHDHSLESGWQDKVQSTSDQELFLGSRSDREELVAIMARGGNSRIIFLYDVFEALRPLSLPPKEKELSTDLYVMF